MHVKIMKEESNLSHVTMTLLHCRDAENSNTTHGFKCEQMREDVIPYNIDVKHTYTCKYNNETNINKKS